VPTAKEHETYARQHFDEAEKMKQTQKLRWGTVAYFYSAMHMVQAALPSVPGLTTAQQSPEAHKGPDGTSTIVLRHITHLYPFYDSLFSSSYKVRYRGGAIANAEIERHRHIDLPPIGQWVCAQTHPADCDCWMRAM